MYRCNATYVSVNSGDFGEISRRRLPVMQSRFALSGLSLCLIMIIPLWISVFTRSVSIVLREEGRRRRATHLVFEHDRSEFVRINLPLEVESDAYEFLEVLK